MCGKCITYLQETLFDFIDQIEAEEPLTAHGESPGITAFPNSSASLIVPVFDTALEAPVLEAGTIVPRELAWGFEESWNPRVVFNTRVESAAKPMWRDSMQHRRCIIPVSSFFETHRSETAASPRTGKSIKRSYEFHVVGEDVILIGCIWKGDRFSMVTTEANEDMAPIHPRMPLIVRQEELPLWLGPDYQQLADRCSIELTAEPMLP